MYQTVDASVITLNNLDSVTHYDFNLADTPNHSQARGISCQPVYSNNTPSAKTFHSAAIATPSGTINYPVPGWTLTGALNTSREEAGYVLLNNGKILAVGGVNDAGYAVATTCELYDPVAKTWTATGSLNHGRQEPGVMLLNDGTVLACGGYDGGAVHLKSAEVYDPNTGLWTSVGDMAFKRYYFGIWKLPSGKVLVAGGLDSTTTAEIYDPVAKTWSNTTNLDTARSAGAFASLPNGDAMYIGGLDHTSSVYNEGTTVWTNYSLPVSYNHNYGIHTQNTAVQLHSGDILIAGGVFNGSATIKCAVFDHVGLSWADTGSISTAESDGALFAVSDGTAIIAGGNDGGTTYKFTQSFNPNTGLWSNLTDLNSLRTAESFTGCPQLADGTPMAPGGSNGTNDVTSVELYSSASVANGSTIVLTGFPTDGTKTFTKVASGPGANQFASASDLTALFNGLTDVSAVLSGSTITLTVVTTGTAMNSATITGTSTYASLSITFSGGLNSNVDVTANTITINNHGFITGLVGQLTTTNTLPSPLATSTNYYIIKVDANTIKLATSLAHAQSGTAIDITADSPNGTTNTFTDTTLSVVIKAQMSNDGIDFTDISGKTVTATSSGSVLWDFGNPSFKILRILITPASGEVSVTLNFHAVNN